MLRQYCLTTSIHPSIFYNRLIRRSGGGGAGAYPSSQRARGGVPPGQVPNYLSEEKSIISSKNFRNLKFTACSLVSKWKCDLHFYEILILVCLPLLLHVTLLNKLAKQFLKIKQTVITLDHTLSAVMRALLWSNVVKKELSRKANLAIYWSIFVPILTYCHEIWIMTERTRS